MGRTSLLLDRDAARLAWEQESVENFNYDLSHFDSGGEQLDLGCPLLPQGLQCSHQAESVEYYSLDYIYII